MRLCLHSNSYMPGQGFLDHCIDDLVRLYQGRRVTFIPFAGSDPSAYAATFWARMRDAGLATISLHEAEDAGEAVEEAEAFFVGGGNTFRLLYRLEHLGVLGAIASAVRAGVPYGGASAGANLAGRTVQTSNDMAIRWPSSPDALGLVPFNVNPHYVDRDPDSPHMGETRERRIAEFLEDNDIPVLGLYEGSAVWVEEGVTRVTGPARWFVPGESPVAIGAGSLVPEWSPG